MLNKHLIQGWQYCENSSNMLGATIPDPGVLHFLYFSILTMVAMETGHFLKMLNDASLATLDY